MTGRTAEPQIVRESGAGTPGDDSLQRSLAAAE